MRRTLTWTPDRDRRKQRSSSRQTTSPQRRGASSQRRTSQPTRSAAHLPQSARRGPSRSSPKESSHRNIAEMYILKQIREKTPMVLHGYGSVQHCTFSRLSKYHLTTVIDGKKKGNEKLELTCYYKQRDEAQVRESMRIDEHVVAQRLEPIRPRKDRYEISSELLNRCRRNEIPIEFTLRSGEVFRGKVLWFTPFDIGLLLPTGVKVMIFRHAIYEAHTTE